MTISLGERHKYIAIRLKRYSALDPYVTATGYEDGRLWTGSDKQSLEAQSAHTFGGHVLGYDLRRRMQAKDPLCCANAWPYRCAPYWPPCSEFVCAQAVRTAAKLRDRDRTRRAAMRGWWVASMVGSMPLSELQKPRKTTAASSSISSFVQRLHQFPALKEMLGFDFKK